jgi:hypothetical protein
MIMTSNEGLSEIRRLAIEVKTGIMGGMVQRKHRKDYAEKLDKIVKMAEFLAFQNNH